MIKSGGLAGDATNADALVRSGVRLEVHGLCKRYGGHKVLQDVDFNVNAGEIFVIIGPSGSGKSVLLRQLIGLEEPDQGEVLVDGHKVGRPEIETRYRVAMVFQSGALLSSMTVGENVGFYLAEHHLKPPGEVAEIVSRELAEVGLPGAENLMPAELSGGMVKRVAIARALTVEPQLIFYDEPTSELDPVSAESIVADIVKLNARTQATTLVVTHDREVAFGIARHIAMLVDGCIIATGTPDEIRRNPDPRVQQFVNASVVPPPAVPWPPSRDSAAVQTGRPSS